MNKLDIDIENIKGKYIKEYIIFSAPIKIYSYSDNQSIYEVDINYKNDENFSYIGINNNVITNNYVTPFVNNDNINNLNLDSSIHSNVNDIKQQLNLIENNIINDDISNIDAKNEFNENIYDNKKSIALLDSTYKGYYTDELIDDIKSKIILNNI